MFAEVNNQLIMLIEGSTDHQALIISLVSASMVVGTGSLPSLAPGQAQAVYPSKNKQKKPV